MIILEYDFDDEGISLPTGESVYAVYKKIDTNLWPRLPAIGEMVEVGCGYGIVDAIVFQKDGDVLVMLSDDLNYQPPTSESLLKENFMPWIQAMG